ncbi:MAG: hypothetical protein ACI8U3_000957 [Brevundimonas sp.]|jgi:hypothetical protein
MPWAEYRPGAAAFRRGWTVGLRHEYGGAGSVSACSQAVATFRSTCPAIDVEEWHDSRYFYVRFRYRSEAALFKLTTA